MRPGLHLSNCSPITPADEDIVRRWAPLSALLAMNNIVEDNGECDKLARLWELAGRPLLVLRKYFEPSWGAMPSFWGVHANESVAMARGCMARGIPASKIALKPFNEPNMPTWACNDPYGEGFGDKPEHIERYNSALKTFIIVAKNQLPDVLIGGPHLTVGNHDVRFPNDAEGRYFYGPSSLCAEALAMLDLHFVHCYGFKRGQYQDRAHGLRFLEYEKYFLGKPIYIVEGCYGIQWENGNAIDPSHNNVRAEDTVAYLRLLDQYPQVKGITLWIGGDRGWQEHRHSDGADPGSHRPVVFYVERYVKDELPAPIPGPIPPTPGPKPEPEPTPEVKMKAYRKDGSEVAPAELLAAYSVSIESCSGPGWRVVEIRERCEAANCDIWLKGQGGQFWASHPVRWGWPGTEVSQKTGPDGRVGFAMSHDGYYDPKVGGGPHWAAVEGNSETVRGIGMISATVHCTLNYVFQYLEAAPEPTPGPTPEPEPSPEPEPIPEVAYTLEGRLAKAPGGFEDLRAQILALSDVAKLKAEAVAIKRIDSAGNPVWSCIELIVLHHLGGKYYGAVNLAKESIRKGNPTAEYHFVIEKSGRIIWLVPMKYRTNHAYAANDHSIGIAFEDEANEAQMEAGRYLIAALYELFGDGNWGSFRLVGLVPHCMIWTGENWHTQCPGAVWPKILTSGTWPDLRGSFDSRLVSVDFDYPGEAEAWEEKVEKETGMQLEVEPL